MESKLNVVMKTCGLILVISILTIACGSGKPTVNRHAPLALTNSPCTIYSGSSLVPGLALPRVVRAADVRMPDVTDLHPVGKVIVSVLIDCHNRVISASPSLSSSKPYLNAAPRLMRLGVAITLRDQLTANP